MKEKKKVVFKIPHIYYQSTRQLCIKISHTHTPLFKEADKDTETRAHKMPVALIKTARASCKHDTNELIVEKAPFSETVSDPASFACCSGPGGNMGE